MVVTIPELDNEIVWLDRAQEVAFFNEQVQTLLHMTGDEFRRKLDAGAFGESIDDPEHSDIMYLALLAASAR